MKVSIYIILLAMLAVCSGCGHTHVVITMNVPQIGEDTIKTKYRYKVIENSKYGEIDNSVQLAVYQPNVFDTSGIPIKIQKSIKNGHSNGSWMLGIMTLGILPVFDSTHFDSQWSISAGEENEAVAAIIESCNHSDWSGSLLSPFGLLFNWGKKTCFRDCCFFDKHSFGFEGDIYNYNIKQLENEALSYGLAIKLKELENSGIINEQVVAKAFSQYNLSKISERQRTVEESRLKKAGEKLSDNNGKQHVLFDIVRLEREKGVDFAYRFVLASKSSNRISLADYNTIRTAFRSSIKEHYLLEHPDLNPRTLVVDFPEYALKNGQIVGRAVVLTISVESIGYDSATRKGRLAVRINVNQFEETRQWIRNNICDLVMEAKKSNGDGFSVGTRFYTENETMNEDGVLVVDFKTE